MKVFIFLALIIVLTIGGLFVASRHPGLMKNLLNRDTSPIETTPQPNPSTPNNPQTETSSGNCKDNSNIAIHSFIHSGYSYETKKYLFQAAKSTCKSLIRFDIPLNAVEATEGKFDFQKTDENVNLAIDNGLVVVATLGYSAPWIAPSGAKSPFQGPIDPEKLDKFIEYIKQTVAHYPQIQYWEIYNEPDLGAGYGDKPEQFAKLLSNTFDAIKEVNPEAKVLFTSPGGDVKKVFVKGGWADKVINDPMFPAKNKFDIANAHIRGTLDQVILDTKATKDYYNNIGRSNAPLWVTEHGYGAEPKYQYDPKFKGTDLDSGEQMQVEYYKNSLPGMITAGAEKVFVTLRDIPEDEKPCKFIFARNAFCSEGLVDFNKSTDTTALERPSFFFFQQF